jgi:hypothetical protein
MQHTAPPNHALQADHIFAVAKADAVGDPHIGQDQPVGPRDMQPQVGDPLAKATPGIQRADDQAGADFDAYFIGIKHIADGLRWRTGVRSQAVRRLPQAAILSLRYRMNHAARPRPPRM